MFNERSFLNNDVCSLLVGIFFSQYCNKIMLENNWDAATFCVFEKKKSPMAPYLQVLAVKFHSSPLESLTLSIQLILLPTIPHTYSVSSSHYFIIFYQVNFSVATQLRYYSHLLTQILSILQHIFFSM